MECCMENMVTCVPQDHHAATKWLLFKLIDDIHPLALKIRSQIRVSEDEEGLMKINGVFSLCLSQMQKCVTDLIEVFGLESKSNMLLQETRQFHLEMLSWCVNRLASIDKHLMKTASQNNNSKDESSNDSFNDSVMYFVNWIDHAFDVLGKLAEAVYKTDYKQNEELLEKWKCDMVECVNGLHVSIDELLLSAMTLYRYCLPNDQLIVKARCQVVLRETKALLSELIGGDLSTAVKSNEALKLPVMPTNINVMIDVLKDVLYALETNTNTALLSLLVHCFSITTSPVDVLKRHFLEGSKMCKCMVESTDDVDDCQFVKDFDLYNERLLQIGSFAESCSSDQDRIHPLRSGLASLEALDPHLVPALMTSPSSCHAGLLVKTWLRSVDEIKDYVFLIVDPAAFVDKSKQMMHQKLLGVLKETSFNSASVCAVVGIGCVVHDFFRIYNEKEPHALCHREKLMPLLDDLQKAISECQVVSNLLNTGDDLYNVKTPATKETTLDRLHKRLKLLYTLVSRINTLLQPKDQLFDEDAPQNLTHTIVKNDKVPFDEKAPRNVTHTIAKNDQTFLKPQQRPDMSRSIFARTHIRSSTRNVLLSRVTKRLRAVNCSQLNFSVELDRLFDISGGKCEDDGAKNKLLDRARETSVLYNFSPIKNRSSMRKMVLNRHLSMSDHVGNKLTEELNQMNLTPENQGQFNRTETIHDTKSVTTVNINTTNSNNDTYSDSANILRIPVISSEYVALNDTILTSNDTILTSSALNVTQPSNVTTLERFYDLELIETKLNILKSQFKN